MSRQINKLKNVVICLKNRTFAVSQTSNILSGKRYIRLWFAWKIVLLQYHKHPTSILKLVIECCDLLEKSYFCSITNIIPDDYLYNDRVVICLKNRTFAVSQTSENSPRITWKTLWFAWKIVLLQYHKHPRQVPHYYCTGCDLLEKSYFCSITNILNTISICTTNRYKDLRNKKNETAKRNPTLGEWDFFFLIMPGVRTIPAVAQVR